MPQLAGMAGGAARALEEILADRFEAEKLQALIAEREQQAQMERERLNETMRNNDFDRKRTERLDAERSAGQAAAGDAAATERRGLQNMAGVMSMGLDPQTAQREIAYSSRDPKLMMEAMKPPPGPKLRSVTVPGPKGEPINRMVPETEDAQEYRAPVAGPKPDKPQVFNVGGRLVDDTGKVIYGGGQGDGGPSPYAQERATRTTQSVDDLIGRVNEWTAGYGSMLSGVPKSDARTLKGKLDTLKANIAFNELTAMREASKTGGALGQVAVRELELLESALGSLDQGLEPAELIANLEQIRDSVQRWTQTAGASANAMRPSTSHEGAAPAAGPAPSPGGRRLRFDKTGKPIP